MKRTYVKNVDWVLLCTVLLLMGMGLLSLYAYTPPVNLSESPLSSTFFKQMAFSAAALAVMFLGMFPKYFSLRRVSYLL